MTFFCGDVKVVDQGNQRLNFALLYSEGIAINLRELIIAGCGLLAALLCNGAGADDSANSSLAAITVEADAFELRTHEELAVWRGSVVVNQGGYSFRASTLTMQLEELIRQEGAAEGETESPTLPNQYHLTAESVTYDPARDLVAGDGECVLRRGSEMVAAERFHFDLNSGIAHALPDSGSRVLVKFFANPASVGFLPLAGENQGL